MVENKLITSNSVVKKNYSGDNNSVAKRYSGDHSQGFVQSEVFQKPPTPPTD